MRLKTSFCNGALLRKNLTRFWPLWAVYAAAWLLAGPVTCFTMAFGRYYQNMEPVLRYHRIIRDYLRTWCEFSQISAVLAGILFAMALFSYVTMPRAVGLFHSFPIRREKLFWTNYLTGISVAVVVQVVAALLEFLVLTAAGIFDRTSILVTLGCSLGTHLFFFSFGVLCVMFTGQILMVPVLYAVLNWLVYGLCSLTQELAQAFYYGFRSDVPGWALWLTPVLRLNRDLSIQGTYDPALETSVDYHLTGLGTVAIYAVAGVVIALMALAVYRRRPSEAAGDTVAVQWAKPFFLWGAALCAALFLGQGLYYLVLDPMLGTDRVFFAGMLICMVALCLIGYWGAAMLMRKSFRVLRATWKGALAAAAVTAALCLCVRADILGVEDYIPPLEQVKSVTFDISGYGNYYYGNLEDAPEIERFLAVQEAILVEKEHLRPDGSAEDDHLSGQLDLNYQLTDGTSVRRSYSLSYLESELDQPDTAMAALAELTSDPIVQRAQLEIHNLVRFTGGDFSQGSFGVSLTAQEAEVLYEAILADVEAGNFGCNAFRQERWEEETYDNRLSLYFLVEDEDAGELYTRPADTYTNSMDLEFSVNATAVIAALEELGLTDRVPLVTQAQAAAERTAQSLG